MDLDRIYKLSSHLANLKTTVAVVPFLESGGLPKSVVDSFLTPFEVASQLPALKTELIMLSLTENTIKEIEKLENNYENSLTYIFESKIKIDLSKYSIIVSYINVH